ncbi:MAG: hypothetical protein ABJQ34_16635 [Paracoccaceae bacterium]
MFFRRKSSAISDDMAHWITECFDWYESNFTTCEGPVLPNKSFFKAGKGKDQATAEAVLADVTRLIGFDLPIDLVPLERLPEEFRHSYQSYSEVAGTYRESEGARMIEYAPERMSRPIEFISTMAHEVIHAQLWGLEDQMPGGIEMHELATDLCAIIAGFGVFQMQGADQSGWAGYLTQETRGAALAYYLKKRELTDAAVEPYLSNRCRKYLRRGWATW